MFTILADLRKRITTGERLPGGSLSEFMADRVHLTNKLQNCSAMYTTSFLPPMIRLLCYSAQGA